MAKYLSVRKAVARETVGILGAVLFHVMGPEHAEAMLILSCVFQGWSA